MFTKFIKRMRFFDTVESVFILIRYMYKNKSEYGILYIE